MRRSAAMLVTSLIFPAVPSLRAQDPLDTVQVRTVSVAPGIYMLMAAGGNIGVSAGPDGVFLVDDQYAPLTERILRAIRSFSDRPIRFVINTHWHQDHTGGNENMGKAGALIVAHDNVRKRMSVEQFMEAFNRTVPPAPPGALPVVTFNQTVTFYMNGDEIHAFHVTRAHTDGDAIIHFRRADVIHMGDTFFNGRYPFIDIGSGGSVDGVIAAADQVLAIAGEQTKIIPGHGPLATRNELREYRDMLAGVRDRVASLISQGRTLEQVLAAGVTAPWDGRFTGDSQRFVRYLYQELAQRGAPTRGR
ncbi:MAG: cyclase [Gemmatimonadales bacterium]|nr:Metallo-beta-lactamase type 2 [bacterium HR33]GIW52300.1 MAG: cyclase [Gemmatimonadales bacterium]